jgi:hypothetical protein
MIARKQQTWVSDPYEDQVSQRHALFEAWLSTHLMYLDVVEALDWGMGDLGGAHKSGQL